MDISVGHVSLRFPLDLTLDDVKIIKDNDSIPSLRDTIADASKIFVDIQLRPLVDKKIEVDALGFEKLRLNTDGLIGDLRVKGNVEKLDLECHGVDLKESLANVNAARLDSACLEICLADTVPPDTTESTNDWKVKVEKLQLNKTRLSIHLPGDTLQMGGYLSSLEGENGYFDFGKGEYKISKIDLKSDELRYDNKYSPTVSGLDTNHLNATDIVLGVDSVSYSHDGLNVSIRTCSFKEKSGIQVDELRGHLELDSVSLKLPDAYLKTPDSKMSANFDLDLNTFDAKNPGKLNADIDGYFGKQDLMRFMGDMPSDFIRKWPNQPLAIKGKARGNMNRMEFKGLNVSLPSAFQLTGDGYVAQLNDIDHLKRSLEETGICYFHAPLFAYGMKFVGPTRKALTIPTCFNLLGPLVNPCHPKNSLHGAANQSQLRLYTNLHQRIGDNFGVITSYDGYDEISLTSGFKICTNNFEKVLTPVDLGLKYIEQSDIYGGETPEDAMKIFDAVLEGTSTEAQKNVVIANAACGISIMDRNISMADSVAMARESLDSGKALQVFKKFVEVNS